MTDLDRRVYEVKSATVSLFGRQWVDNYRVNLQAILKKPGITKLAGRFKGLPAVLVGAGPSLDKNVHLLSLAKGRSLIISCDAAVKVLSEHSLTPDIVVNLDPQPAVLNFFDGIDTKNMTLVAPTIGLPDLVGKWRGNIFFYNQHAPDIPVLAGIALKHPKLGSLTPGGSVLSVAFDLAFRSGADPIAFLGQDLSYPEQKAYASGSHFDNYAVDDLFELYRDHIVEEKDIFGRKLRTQKSMSVTKKWFKWAFETWNRDKKRRIFNCSESGILTECPMMSFSEFVSRFCGRKYNVPWILKKASK